VRLQTGHFFSIIIALPIQKVGGSWQKKMATFVPLTLANLAGIQDQSNSFFFFEWVVLDPGTCQHNQTFILIRGQTLYNYLSQLATLCDKLECVIIIPYIVFSPFSETTMFVKRLYCNQ